MGLNVLAIEVGNVAAPDVTERIEFLVDSGAIFSVVPSGVLTRLGIRPLVEQEFRLADGSKITRKKGGALFKRAKPGEAESFQWMETPTGEIVLLSLRSHRYLRIDPQSREVDATSAGPLPDRSDGVRFEWRAAGS